MRTIFLFTTLPLFLQAQPTPELSIALLGDGKGSPMSGPYAGNVRMHHALRKGGVEPWTVEMHFTVSKDYPYSEHEIGTQKFWPPPATPIRDRLTVHLQFHILDCFCKDQYLLVIQGGDTMRVDMPNGPNTRGHLVHQMVARSGAVSSPEVIRFRPGRFNFTALAQDPSYHELESRLAERVLARGRARKR